MICTFEFFFILNHIKQVWLALCRRNTNQIVVICINDVCTIFTSMTISFSCKPLPIFFSFKQYSSLSVVLSIYKKKYLKPTFRHNHKLHNTFWLTTISTYKKIPKTLINVFEIVHYINIKSFNFFP